MTDLRTTYLGIEFDHPILAASSPLSKKLDDIKKMEDAGVAGVVMYSLFEEQIRYESQALNFYLERGTSSFAEAITYFPDLAKLNVGPDLYLELIRKARESVSIPIIASLNGYTPGGWVDYALQMQEAGAHALELNIYSIPADFTKNALEVEDEYVELVRSVRSALSIPLAVKLGPFFTALPHFCQRLVKAGAQGLVFFNRFYQPDLDIQELKVTPNLELSTSSELRLPLRWIAMLYGRIQADFALTSGVHTGEDVVKSVMAGARAAMVAAEFLQNGVQRAGELRHALETWMQARDYDSVREMTGAMSQKNVGEPEAFERANYMQALSSLDHQYHA